MRWHTFTAFLLALGLMVLGVQASAGTFTIEPRLLGQSLKPAQRATVEEAARRVSALITSGYQPIHLNVPKGECDRHLPSIDETLDHFVVYVVVRRVNRDVYADSIPCTLHNGTFLPAYGMVDLNTTGLNDLTREDLLDTMMHEMLHTLGIGSLWLRADRISVDGTKDRAGLITRVGSRYFYTAPAALAAYRALGGRQKEGIPLDNDASHWRGSAVCSELMSGESGKYTERVNPISPITLAALQDLGYSVDLSKASRYILPTKGCTAQAAAVRQPLSPLPAEAPKGTTMALEAAPYFENCKDARASGATPLLRGQPGYRPGLDGDGDGRACDHR